MKKYKQNFILFLFIMLTVPTFSRSRDITVVPKPQIVKQGKGDFVFHPKQTGFILTGIDTSLIAVRQLQNAIIQKTGFKILLNENKAKKIWLGIPNKNSLFRRTMEKSGVWPDNRIGKEGYILLIEPDRMLLAASTDAGIFYDV